MDPAYVATHVEEDRRHWWFRGRLAVLLAILRRVLPPGHARLLELGCGTGNVLAALAEFGEAVGMETHPDLAAAARAAGLDVRTGRLPDDLVVPPGWADAVLLLDVIEHLDDDVAALETARRAPRPGGRLLAALAPPAAVWLALDRRPPEWDHANHLERAVICAQDLARGDLHAVLERSSFYPPLVLCAAGLVYRLAPSDVAAAQAVVLAFLALGVSAVYVLAHDLGGATAGVVAALVFATAPFVVFSSLHFQLDLPLASMVALILIVLLRIEAFEHRGWSVAAGIVLGLGMLTKPPFAVYVLAPLVLAAARIRSRRAVTNLTLALLIGGALSLPWYGPRVFSLVPGITSRSFRQAAESGHPEPLTAGALTLYPRWFPTQFGFVAGLLVLLGLGVAAQRRHWLLLAALLPALTLLELLQNKNLRYTLPLLPVAAVLAGLGFSALPGRLKAGAGGLLLVAGVMQVSATAFGVPHISLPVVDVPFVVATPPVRDDWRQREILALLARDSRGAPATVSVVPNYALFSASNFRYYALRDGLPLKFVRAWDGEPVGIAYMVLKSGEQGPPWTAERPRRIAERLATDPHLARVFPVT